jgi:hypothetical protein
VIAASPRAVFAADAAAEFRLQAERAGLVERRVRLAARTVDVRFADPALAQLLFEPLRHAAAPHTGAADATIDVWDAAGRGVPPPWTTDDLLPGGLVRRSDSRDPVAVHEMPSGTITLAGAGGGEVLYRVGDRAALTWWERAAPLRLPLYWALGGDRRHLVHAAAVADAHGGVVLVGPPRSGKSTAVAAALELGLDLVGDDYVLLDASDGPCAHALYDTVCTAVAPGVEPKRVRTTAGRVRGRVRLRAAVAARIGGGRSRLVRARPAELLRAWAPATAVHMPFDRGAVVATLARVLDEVPCYRLEVGDDPRELGGLVAAALEGRCDVR